MGSERNRKFAKKLCYAEYPGNMPLI